MSYFYIVPKLECSFNVVEASTLREITIYFKKFHRTATCLQRYDFVQYVRQSRLLQAHWVSWSHVNGRHSCEYETSMGSTCPDSPWIKIVCFEFIFRWWASWNLSIKTSRIIIKPIVTSNSFADQPFLCGRWLFTVYVKFHGMQFQKTLNGSPSELYIFEGWPLGPDIF